MGKLAAWLKGLGIFQYVLLLIFGFALVSAAAEAVPHSTTVAFVAKPHKDTTTLRTETETETVAVPYGQTTVDDPTFQPGYSEITTPGQNGTKVITYQLTYMDGVVTKKQAVKEEVTVPPVNEVTSVGPYAPDMPDPLAGNPDTPDCVVADDGTCQ
ncbi:MAG TPA: G5 domain-containing protein [Candidatus Saccharimonadales bacterium]|nr:G5 domain-containing protein [Candidatus Saccharimonadales bacterium]